MTAGHAARDPEQDAARAVAQPAPGVPARAEPPASRLLALQRAVGNRAVSGLLGRQAVPAPAAPASKGRPGLERQVGDWFNVIQKLKHDRIESWEKNALIAEPAKLSEDALHVGILIASEGMGGVVYGMVEKMLAKRGLPHLVDEFIMLAGLEAGDLAAEAAFHHAMDLTHADLDRGIREARTREAVADIAKVVLKTKTDALGIYVEMLKLQTIKEEAEQHVAFNKVAQDRSDQELIQENAGLKLLYDQLLKAPEDYLRQLTVDFIRLLDESALKAKDAAHGGDRGRTFREDPSARATWLRPGTLQVSPTTQHSLGSWFAPDLNFELGARAMQLNTQALQTMVGTELGRLPLTIGFSFGAKNPYSGWFTGSHVSLWFTRDPAGRVAVEYFDEAAEWLASYYSRQTAEHTDAERTRLAPLGAAKLYDAIKTKPLAKVEHVD